MGYYDLSEAIPDMERNDKMSVQAVREYLSRFGVDGRIQEFT